MANRIEFTGDINIYLKFLNSSSTIQNIEQEVRKGTTKASIFLINKVKNNIKSQKNLPPNAPLTQALSKGELTLLKEGNLFKALGFTLKNGFESEVGVLDGKNSTGNAQGKSIDIETVVFRLHKGFTINVTDEVRAAINIALRESNSSKAKQGIQGFKDNRGKGKSTFRVKPIPFLENVFGDSSNQEEVRRIYKLSLENAFRKSGVKGNDSKFKG